MSGESRGKTKAKEGAGRLTPGEHLRAEIERLGLDQVAVSKATGVSRQSVNNIVNGRQPISRAMAGKLGRLTARSSDYWLGEFFSASSKASRLRDARSAAGMLVNHQILRAVGDGVIGISPFLVTNVRAAAIDLTCGKALTLPPGAAATVRTKERIELPLDYVGRAGAAGRLTRAGIVTGQALQVEPGFKGHLEFCLFNTSRTALRLRGGEVVLSVEFIRLAATPDAVTT